MLFNLVKFILIVETPDTRASASDDGGLQGFANIILDGWLPKLNICWISLAEAQSKLQSSDARARIMFGSGLHLTAQICLISDRIIACLTSEYDPTVERLYLWEAYGPKQMLLGNLVHVHNKESVVSSDILCI